MSAAGMAPLSSALFMMLCCTALSVTMVQPVFPFISTVTDKIKSTGPSGCLKLLAIVPLVEGPGPPKETL